MLVSLSTSATFSNIISTGVEEFISFSLSTNLVSAFWKSSLTVPIGPFLCFPIIISASSTGLFTNDDLYSSPLSLASFSFLA